MDKFRNQVIIGNYSINNNAVCSGAPRFRIEVALVYYFYQKYNDENAANQLQTFHSLKEVSDKAITFQ